MSKGFFSTPHIPLKCWIEGMEGMAEKTLPTKYSTNIRLPVIRIGALLFGDSLNIYALNANRHL